MPSARLPLAAILLGLVALAGAVLVLRGRRPTPPDLARDPDGREVEDRERPAGPRLRGAPDVAEPAPAGDAAGRAPSPRSSWEPEHLPASEDVVVVDAWTGRRIDVAATVDLEVLQCEAPRFFADVVAPEGYVAWGEVSWPLLSGSEQSRTERWEVVVPLRREVQAWVTARRADGRPVANGTLAWGFGPRPEATVDVREATVRIRGIPFFRGALLWLEARDGDATGRALYGLSTHPDDPVQVELELLEPPEIDYDEVETDEDLPFEESLGEDRADPPPPPGSLAVVVLRRDGTPAARVLVAVEGGPYALTGDDGAVRIEKVPAGPCRVKALAPGLVPAAATVTVPSGGTAAVDLREPEGGTVEVVVRKRGVGPLPFARVELDQPSRVAWIDLENGLRRVDEFTDEAGRKVFRHVEPGSVIVKVRWAGQWQSVGVGVEEGRTSRAEMWLR